VRKLIDCLIAAVAIDADVPILHADTDFEVIARHTALVISDV
jgi:predicted nucleic acid-binding protein